MNYLVDLGFTEQEVNLYIKNNPEKLVNLLINGKKLVMVNLSYLKNLGILNYVDIFYKYAETFLMDHSSFVEIFEKYEAADLVQKLNNNINIYEYL